MKKYYCFGLGDRGMWTQGPLADMPKKKNNFYEPEEWLCYSLYT